MGISATVCLDGGRHSWHMLHIETVWDSDIKHCWCVKCGSRTEFIRKKGMARDKWRRTTDAEMGGLYIEIPTLLAPKKKRSLNMRKHMLELDQNTDVSLAPEPPI